MNKADEIKVGDTIEVECGKQHRWQTKAVTYCDSWRPETGTCSECGGVYLTADKVERKQL